MNKGVYLATSTVRPSMTSALQVLSSKAVVIWSLQRGLCDSLVALTEELWLLECMQKLQVNELWFPILQSTACYTAMDGSDHVGCCDNFRHAAFGPLTSVSLMDDCSARAS